MPRGGDAGGGKKGSSVQFSKPQEPSFLRDLKRQVGYKDPVEDMNAKVLLYSCFDIVLLNRYALLVMQENPYFSSIFIFMQRKSTEGLDNNQEDKDDEKPTVVVLNDGDLSEEEAQKIKAVQAGNKMVMELFNKN